VASITSPTVIRVKNAVDNVVVPFTRAFKFTGGLVVTQVSPGEAQVEGLGIASAWAVVGNAGAGLVLGTTTNDEFNFIQNNQSRAGFRQDGDFFLKTHVGVGAVEQSTNAVTTIDALPVAIFILNVPLVRVGRLVARIQGRKDDGSGRAAFERSFLFYQEGLGVVVSPKVQTDFTDKSDVAYDVRVVTSGNDVIIQVVGKILETIKWSGHFQWQTID
jgi:hypothetical protein